MWKKILLSIALVGWLVGCDNSQLTGATPGTSITAEDLALSVSVSSTKTLNFSWANASADDYVLCKDNAGTCEQVAVINPSNALTTTRVLDTFDDESAINPLESPLSYTLYLDTLIPASDEDGYYVQARINSETVDGEILQVVYKSFDTIIGHYEPQNPAIGQNHGHVMAVSGDGLTMIISTLISSDPDVNSGEVIVYRRGDDGWAQQTLLTSSVPASDPTTGFGFDLDINDDGTVIVIGAWKQTISATTNAGAAYIFTLSGTTWSNTSVIENPAPTTSDFFASSVSISGDGTVLAIGAYNEDSDGTTITNTLPANDLAPNSGSVYLYKHNSGTWDFEWRFKASNADNSDLFGRKVRLNKLGDVLLATATGEDSYTGAPTDDSVFNVGAAYVYREQPNNTWLEEGYLKSTFPIEFSGFGNAAAISHTGDIIAIGVSNESDVASTDNTGLDLMGAVHLWHYDGSNWLHHARLVASNAEDGDAFGTSVAIGNNGNWLAVGAQYEDASSSGIDPSDNGNTANNAGAAYIFELNGSWLQTHYLKSPNTEDVSYFGKAIAFSALQKELLISAPSAPINDVKSGVVYLF
ncbi:FG-GAP repeat protein [Enterovibrio makurazakiensis]|uniref:FG-GAP repeat protein n=1 Tax=Enterovibrio makurazakiensis TaxID=2910232 RepID=UPI003D23A60D